VWNAKGHLPLSKVDVNAKVNSFKVDVNAKVNSLGQVARVNEAAKRSALTQQVIIHPNPKSSQVMIPKSYTRNNTRSKGYREHL